MKIAFVIYSLDKGGAERVVSLLSLELSKQYDVSIIVFENSIVYEYGGEIFDLQLPAKKGKIAKIINIFKRTKSLKKILQQKNFDKIFAFMESAYMPAILTGFEVVASVRNNPHKYSKYVTKYLLPRAKQVVTPSQGIEDMLKDEFGIKRCSTIKNPVDFTMIDRLKLEAIEEKENFLIAAGRLHPQKGFDLLIDAYALSSVQKKIKMLIFGDGALKEELQRKIDEKNLSEYIVLKGKTDNLYKYLYRAKMFILSSRYEGFPNVLIEALSCGVASIATNCPTGPSEIIQNEFNGLLVENENTKALAKAIDRVFFDKELQEKFRKNARKSIEHLSVEKIAQKWIEL